MDSLKELNLQGLRFDSFENFEKFFLLKLNTITLSIEYQDNAKISLLVEVLRKSGVNVIFKSRSREQIAYEC